MSDYEYYIHQLGENLWHIYKVDTWHNKIQSATYEVKRLRTNFYCDCPAPGYCKHIEMVKKPKKDLF